MREAYIDWTPRGEHAAMVGQAVGICQEYARQGYDLTLRQLYYQFVARDLIPNTMRSYKNLGSLIDKARLAGLLDWDYIVDRTRNVYGTDGRDTSPAEAIETTAGGYGRQLWADQPVHVEVWVEKEALSGVVQRAANDVQVNYFACRGYVSQSEMRDSGRRFRRYSQRGKAVHVLHLGDHDPSGIDMSRDIRDRLDTFAGYGVVTLERIALNMAQVEQYEPPPNPAKVTDSRFEAYQDRFGDESWELDALDPATLNALIVDRVRELRDEDLWTAAVERQEEERDQLQRVSDRWDEVVELVS